MKIINELLEEIKKWEILFSENPDLIFLGRDYKDIEKANTEKKNSNFFWFSKLFADRG